MAKDDLTGNIATETLIASLSDIDLGLHQSAFDQAKAMSIDVFPI